MTEGAAAANSIAFIGFGEAAQAFLAGWRTEPGFGSWSPHTTSRPIRPFAAVREGKRADYARANVFGASTSPEAVAGAHAIFSVVTADQAHEAAVAAIRASRWARSSSTAIPARRKPRRERQGRSTPRAGAMSTSR